MLLNELNDLLKQPCDKCKTYQMNNRKRTCDCYVALRIREIGNELDKLVLPRVCESVELLGMIKKFDDLDKPLYIRLKFFHITDKAIREKTGIDYKSFMEWKREVGIKAGQYTIK